jgi:hypothetical protein
LILPGQASILIPKDGTAQQCITSEDVIKNLVNLLLTIVIEISGSKTLKELLFKSEPYLILLYKTISSL